MNKRVAVFIAVVVLTATGAGVQVVAAADDGSAHMAAVDSGPSP